MNQIINGEVVFAKENNRRRGILHGYHSKPSPRDDFKKGGKRDIAGLPKKTIGKVACPTSGDAKYTIGYEVEKNSITRFVMKEYALFCGFERDGSCGVEAVTNPIPLLPPSMWRTKVFDLFHQASRVFEDTYSPSDNRCGGHITISVDGMRGEELLRAMRPYAGLLMAMFRKRLGNHFCGYNPTLRTERENWYGDYHSKYRVALPKDNIYVGDDDNGNSKYVHLLEWRLPSRFTDTKQAMARYEFFYEWVDMSVNGDGSEKSYKMFLKKVRPIVERLYGGNTELVDKVYEYSHKFRSFIMDAPTKRDSAMAQKHQEVIGFLYGGL